jgi:hypothetical protein
VVPRPHSESSQLLAKPAYRERELHDCALTQEHCWQSQKQSSAIESQGIERPSPTLRAVQTPNFGALSACFTSKCATASPFRPCSLPYLCWVVHLDVQRQLLYRDRKSSNRSPATDPAALVCDVEEQRLITRRRRKDSRRSTTLSLSGVPWNS